MCIYIYIYAYEVPSSGRFFQVWSRSSWVLAWQKLGPRPLKWYISAFKTAAWIEVLQLELGC